MPLGIEVLKQTVNISFVVVGVYDVRIQLRVQERRRLRLCRVSRNQIVYVDFVEDVRHIHFQGELGIDVAEKLGVIPYRVRYLL